MPEEKPIWLVACFLFAVFPLIGKSQKKGFVYKALLAVISCPLIVSQPVGRPRERERKREDGQSFNPNEQPVITRQSLTENDTNCHSTRLIYWSANKLSKMGYSARVLRPWHQLTSISLSLFLSLSFLRSWNN